MPFTAATEPFPPTLLTEDFALRPITAEDTDLDHAAVMNSREHLRLWRQSTWPEDDFTVEANRVDVTEMAERHVAGRAFSYTVLDLVGTTCLGCVYVFAPDATFLTKTTVTAVSNRQWADVDAVVFFWVRPAQMASGAEGRLLTALRTWFADVWRLSRTVYATSEPFTQQVDLLAGTDLELQFELQEPDNAGKRLVFG